MRCGIVRNVSLVQSYRFAIEDVGQGFISCGGITLRSGRNSHSADEVLVQLTFQSQAHADAGAVAVLGSSLLETLAAYPNVAREPESTDRRRQSRYFFLVILGSEGGVGGIGANIRNVGLQLGHRVRGLISRRSCRAGLGLCVLQLALGLLQLLLRLLYAG